MSNTSPYISDILGKLNELRAVFVLGQRALPFLEEVVLFMKDISPLIGEIHLSIQDSAIRMPHASSQLENVTQATELATTEILNIVDRVLNDIGKTLAMIDAARNQLNEQQEADQALQTRIGPWLNDAPDDVRTAVNEHFEASSTRIHEALNHLEPSGSMLKGMRAPLNQILMSLQVQDITSQQIASVTHLIESIRDKLSLLIKRISSEEHNLGLEELVGLEHGQTFDAHARYDTSGSRQSLADELIAAFNPQTSPDDIDQLFGGGKQAASDDDIDQLFGGGGKQAASDDDIDQLFGGGGSDTPLSADDIGDLFGESSPPEESPPDDDDPSADPSPDRSS